MAKKLVNTRTKLANLLYERGISHHDVAVIAGVSDAFMSYVIAGTKYASIPVLKRIAEYLGVTLDEIVD